MRPLFACIAITLAACGGEAIVDSAESLICFKQLTDNCGDRYEYYCTTDLDVVPESPLGPNPDCTPTDDHSVCCDTACIHYSLNDDMCEGGELFVSCHDDSTPSGDCYVVGGLARGWCCS